MLKKILIVDDSPVAIRILKVCLPDDLGVECFTAKDGAEGLQAFKTLKPDLTFLDLTMPVMDGFEALGEIMKIDKNAIVIIVSSDIQRSVVGKILSLGAFLMLNKPPSKESVKAAIDKVTTKICEMRLS